MKSIILIILLSHIVLPSWGQRRDTIKCKLETAAQLPKALQEISGMVYTPDGLWVLNDGDNGSFIFLIGDDGKIKQIKKIANAPNYDWEELTSDAKGNLFIADIGNNNNTRRTLQIYKVNNPMRTDSGRISASKIEFRYGAQKEYPPKNSRMIFDAEAMVFMKDTLVIFSKNRTQPYTGYVHVYKIPTKTKSQSIVAVDSLYLGGTNSLNSWVTGAAISKNGNMLALLSHDKIWLLDHFVGTAFRDARIRVLKLNHYSQKEALCFDHQDNLLIADELFEKILGGKLYRLTLPK